MPEPALPIPHNPALKRLVSFRREYRDLLQRPMSGRLVLTTDQVHTEGGTSIFPAPVRVQVVDGVLALDLPPGTYTLTGQLWNPDEEQVSVEETVTVEEA